MAANRSGGWRIQASVNLTETAAISIEIVPASDDREAEMPTLFVGNLPYDVDDKGLSTYFLTFGVVSRAKVALHKSSSARSRGFGYVTFQSEAAAEAALNHHEPHVLNGQHLTLQVAERFSPSWHKKLRVRRQVLQLTPGVVWLRGHLGEDEQRRLADLAIDAAGGVGQRATPSGGGPGFYRPSYLADQSASGAPRELNLNMCTFGKHWDCRRGAYDAVRTDHDQLPCEPIPAAFVHATRRVLQEVESRFAGLFPEMHPDICIANMYEAAGSLGLHQDRDESDASIAAGKPVVSFSFGDAAIFQYLPDAPPPGASIHKQPRRTVRLRSGDALVFGGPARMIYHGVHHLIPDSCTTRPWNSHGVKVGRLNLTLREY